MVIETYQSAPARQVAAEPPDHEPETEPGPTLVSLACAHRHRPAHPRAGAGGRIETYVRGLLAGLAAEASPHRWTAFANPRPPDPWRRRPGEPWPSGRCPVRPGRRPRRRLAAILRGRCASRRLARAVERRAGAFDLVHFPLTVPVPPPPGSVVTVHDLQHEVMPEFFSRAERAYRAVVYTRRDPAGPGAGDDQRVQQGDDRRAPRDRPGARAGQPPGRRPLAVPARPDASLLRELELPERFVVYPANLWPHKNHGRLLEALALVRDRELAIVLTGQHVGRLAALEGAAPRPERSRAPPGLRRPEAPAPPLPPRGRHGLSSLFEGFGLPPLEALACGCPVAASRAASLPEVLRGHASLFDPRDPEAIAAAIEWLLTAGPPRAGEDFWRRFTWAECARVHRAAYALAAAG